MKKLSKYIAYLLITCGVFNFILMFYYVYQNIWLHSFEIVNLCLWHLVVGAILSEAGRLILDD